MFRRHEKDKPTLEKQSSWHITVHVTKSQINILRRVASGLSGSRRLGFTPLPITDVYLALVYVSDVELRIYRRLTEDHDVSSELRSDGQWSGSAESRPTWPT